MFCNRCGHQAEPGQAACAECGAELAAVEPTRPIEVVGGDGHAVGEPTQRLDIVDADPGAALPPPPAGETPVAAPPLQAPTDEVSEADEASEADGVEHAPPVAAVEPDSGAAAAPDDEEAAPVLAPVAAPRLYDLAEDEPDLLRDTPAAVATVTAAPSPATTAATTPIPVTSDETTPLLDGDDDRLFGRFRFGIVPALGVLTGMTALFGLFPRVVEIRTSASSPAFLTGDWFVGDLGGNLAGAMVVALVALLVGVVGAGFGQRWAAGLAGGAGLAIAGWSAMVVGLAERPLATAIDAVNRPTTEAFTVTLTRDVAYWVLLVAGVLGVLTFVASLASAGRDRSTGLNPWIAAIGAVAAVIAAAGLLIPEGAASVSDNWTPDAPSAPAWFVVGRLVQLGLLAYAGVIGFLLVRSYGLGLVIGGLSVSLWLVVSTLFDLGDAGVGPGVTNPGDTGSIDLHAVTIVGSTALVGLTVVAVIAAVEQSARRPDWSR